MTDEEETGVQLRPSRGQALGWSLVGGGAVAIAAWLVQDARGHPLTIVLLVASLLAAVPWLAQLLTPRAFTWEIDERGLVVRRLHRRLVVGWDEVRFARVVAVHGEPALQLYLRPVRAGADGAPHGSRGRRPRASARHGGPGPSHTLRLPVGADITVLHQALARHLGSLPDGTSPPGGEGSSRAGPAVRPRQ